MKISLDKLHDNFEEYFINKLGLSRDDDDVNNLFECRDEDEIYSCILYLGEVVGIKKGLEDDGIGDLQGQFITDLGLEDLELTR
jgi:hypothetical protein